MKSLNFHIFLALTLTVVLISAGLQATTDKFSNINWSMKFDGVVKFEGQRPDVASGPANAPTALMYKNVSHLGLTGDKAYVFEDKKLVLVVFGVDRNNLSTARADSSAMAKGLTKKFGEVMIVREGKSFHPVWSGKQSQVSLGISSTRKGVYTAMAYYRAL